ncbi:MAG: DUF4282 domain-containing protein [Planctomycetes bacterium]|nr:DUF4282 domain-containing protein [Planctomycetota bacterium]
MPIVTQCPKCGKRLKAPDDRVGQQAKCPQCQTGFTIASVSEGSVVPQNTPTPERQVTGKPSPSGSATTASAPKIPTPGTEQGMWHVQTADGAHYGPVTKADLDAWVTDERLDAECQVLMDGWEQWKWAEEVYPQLAASVTPTETEKHGLEDMSVSRERIAGEGNEPPISAVSPVSGGGGQGRNRVKPSSSSGHLVDILVFRRMIVPVIVQAIFWIGVVLSILSGLGTIVQGMQNNFSVSQITIGFLTLVLGPVWVRVTCEIVIVIFRINETLSDIRSELRRPDRNRP